MRNAVALRLGLTASGVILALASCNRSKSDTPRETGAVTSDSAGEPAVATVKGKVPLSTKSEEAKKLYQEGLAFFDQIRFHDARGKFLEAESKDPDFAMAHYQLALTTPSNKEGLEHVKKAVALADKASDGERLQILALEAGFNGDPAKSLEYSKQASQTYPDDERLHQGLAFAYGAQQDYDKAIDELNKAIKLDPNFAPAYNSLGYMYKNVKKNSDAEQAFKKYIELVPNDPNPHDSYAELLLNTGRFDESIVHYRKALSIDPHFSNSHFGIAANLMYQGKHDQALAEAGKLAASAQNDGDRRLALFTKSVVYADEGKIPQAISEVEKTYALDSKGGDNANMAGDAQAIGFFLLQSGQVEQAAKRFQQALDLQVNSALPADVKEAAKLGDHYNLARLALAKKDLTAAKSHAAEFQKGAESKGNEFRTQQAHELNGTIAVAEKDYDTAISELEKASQQDPYVTYQLAMSYEGKGDKAKAGELYKQAAEAYILPTYNYVLIRAKAKQRAASQSTS